MLDNSSTSIPLPEDIKKTIETARNNITILQGEIIRLRNLCASIEGEIATKEAYRKDLDGRCSAMAQEIETKKLTSEELTESLGKLRDEIDRYSAELRSAHNGLDNRLNDINEREKVSVAREAEILKRELSLTEAQKLAEQSKQKCDTIIARLKEIIT